MSKVGEGGSRRYFQRAMQNHPGLMNDILTFSDMLAEGKYPNYVWFGQVFRTDFEYWNILTFARLQTMKMTGELVFAQLEIGYQPLFDIREKENESILNNNINEYFRAKVVGGNGDNDGTLSWSESIELRGENENGDEISLVLPPGSCSLEIGMTEFETTYYHLFTNYVVARWPYERDYVVLIALTDPMKYIGNPHNSPYPIEICDLNQLELFNEIPQLTFGG